MLPKTEFRKLLRGADKTAQRKFFMDDSGIVLQVCGARHNAGEFGKVAGAPHALNSGALAQERGNRDEVNGFSAAKQVLHGAVNVGMPVHIKGLWRNEVHNLVHPLRTQHQRAQKRALCVRILRGYAGTRAEAPYLLKSSWCHG